MQQRGTENPKRVESSKLILSIIIPARNEAKRLPRTLEHILAYLHDKTWDAEIIVVNDGSTDETSDVVRQFTKANPCVTLIDNPVNMGK